MKNKALLFLPLVTLLTGCSFSSSLSKAKFESNLEQVVNNINAGQKNVAIRDRLGTTAYNYKEGEFYSYHYFVVALILPIEESNMTWKDEDGKYYHYTYNNLNKTKKLVEIDETTFNTYMQGHKETIHNLLMEPVNTTYDLLNENKDKYTSVSNQLKKDMFSNEFYIKSKVTYRVQNGDTYENHQKTITIKYKNNLPIEHTSKEDGTSTRKFSYGDAKFSKPSTDSSESN